MWSKTGDFETSKILEKAKKIPHLRNINMDPGLCGTIKILLEGEGTKIVGVPGKSDIGLKGFGYFQRFQEAFVKTCDLNLNIFSILEKHCAIINKGGKYSIERYGDARVLRNGKLVTTPTELNHLDRLVFGTTQYFVFTDPAKATPNQPYYDFQAMQDEIGREAGVVSKDNKNMSQGSLLHSPTSAPIL